MESSPGKIKFSQYVGNIILNNVTLQTITQYVYTMAFWISSCDLS